VAIRGSSSSSISKGGVTELRMVLKEANAHPGRCLTLVVLYYLHSTR
jgi:hypothetical protein